LTRERREITRAAGTIGLATFTSRILGFLRDMILARLFGATMASDAFFVAYRIPSMLRELFAEGSMSAAFIPVFTQTLTQKDRDEARRLASAAFTTLLILLLVVTLLAMIAAPWIVRLIAPGFVEQLGKFNLTVMLSRFMFPYLMFISLAALAMGILNSLRAFFVPAFSPVLFNVVIIASVLWLSPNLTEPIFGAAVGVTLGGLAQFLVQIPSLKKRGMLPAFSRNPLHPGVKRIGWLILPTMIGLSVTQVNILVNTLLASFLEEGSLTFLYYGMRLVLFPLGIFGVALGTAILPSLSAQAAAGRMDELKNTLAFGLRMVFFIIIPAMVGLMVLRVPIIHLFLEHGVFTSRATAGTATAVLFYAVGLPAFAGVRIVVAAFYALQDTKTPVKVAATAMVVNIILNLALMIPLKHGGLALATSLSALLNLSLLVWIINRRLAGIPWDGVVRSVRNVAAATVPVGLIGWGVSRMPLWATPGDWIEKGVWLAGGIGLAVAVYFAIHRWFASEEMDYLFGTIRNRAGRGEGGGH
jgi:putative peptidoglycan lipid II flippase